VEGRVSRHIAAVAESKDGKALLVSSVRGQVLSRQLCDGVAVWGQGAASSSCGLATGSPKTSLDEKESRRGRGVRDEGELFFFVQVALCEPRWILIASIKR
jgi:hypothetical protein